MHEKPRESGWDRIEQVLETGIDSTTPIGSLQEIMMGFIRETHSESNLFHHQL